MRNEIAREPDPTFRPDAQGGTTRPLFNFMVEACDADIENYALATDLDDLVSRDPAILGRISSKGDLCWCLQSYLILKSRNWLSLQCSNRTLPGAINIVHSDHLLNLRGSADDFLVCVRADYPRRRWAQYHLIQNMTQEATFTSYIPLWTQPHLIGRDDRRIGVRRVAYAGEITNGNFIGDIETWNRQLEPFGVEFVQLPSNAWHDLSALDVLIGIRSFDGRRYNSKPPSKLLNAWHARIPFIGGSDSAFSQVGEPGVNYLRADTASEAVAAVLRLRDDPDLFDRLVRNGADKALLYTEDTIAEKWVQALLGPVLCRYESWRSLPSHVRHSRFDLGIATGLLEHNAKQTIKKLIRHPSRIRTAVGEYLGAVLGGHRKT